MQAVVTYMLPSVSLSVCHAVQLGFTVRGHSVQTLPNHFGLLLNYTRAHRFVVCFSAGAMNGVAAVSHVVTSSARQREVVGSPLTSSPTRPTLTVTHSGIRSPVAVGDPLLSAYRTPSPLLGLMTIDDH